MSFQIFLLVKHFTNWTGHNLLKDKTLKKITQAVLESWRVVLSLFSIIMQSWPDICKIWLDNVRLPTVISRTEHKTIATLLFCAEL